MPLGMGIARESGMTIARRALVAGAAFAAYALRNRFRAWRQSEQPQPQIAGSNGSVAETDGRGAGITHLPRDAEQEQQAALPPRGTRRDGVHA